MAERQYDIIVLGATGYTGKYSAEHITTHFPTSVKWAIAGRSSSKLNALLDELKSLNPSRTPLPDVITTGLSPQELSPLVTKTKVLINAVGPYHKYSTPIVEACANHGTHYVDVTGETLWVDEILNKYESAAQASGAIIVPEIGMESAPSDLITFAAAKFLQKKYNTGISDMVTTLYKIKAAGFSGGTLATAIGLADHYPLSTILKMQDPLVLTPSHQRAYANKKPAPAIPQPTTYTRTFFNKLFGVWSYPGLGLMTTHPGASPNIAIVNRSASMNPSLYGTGFNYAEYMSIRSAWKGAIFHLVFQLIAFFIIFVSPVRWLVQNYIIPHQPGGGPTRDSSKNNYLEVRGIATPTNTTSENSNPAKRVMARFRWTGEGMYALSGILMVEAAMEIIENESSLRQSFGVAGTKGGAFLTPSCLGETFIERIAKVGMDVDAEEL